MLSADNRQEQTTFAWLDRILTASEYTVLRFTGGMRGKEKSAIRSRLWSHASMMWTDSLAREAIGATIRQYRTVRRSPSYAGCGPAIDCIWSGLLREFLG